MLALNLDYLNCILYLMVFMNFSRLTAEFSTTAGWQMMVIKMETLDPIFLLLYLKKNLGLRDDFQ